MTTRGIVILIGIFPLDPPEFCGDPQARPMAGRS